MSDYRVTIRARNARILRRIEDMGFDSLAGFCRTYQLNYPLVASIIAMKETATTSRGEWRSAVIDLATALRVEPGELFTDRQMSGGVKAVVREVDEEQLIALTDAHSEQAALPPPSDALFVRELLDKTKLTERERKVLNIRFGLDGGGSGTLEDAAQVLNTGRERIRQIEAKALRRIRDHAAFLKGQQKVLEA